MGIDPNLFVDGTPSDCLCTICSEVMEDPLETQSCQHAFCKVCITTWLSNHATCPTCRQTVGHAGLRPLHRVWRDKLFSLTVRCGNHKSGCLEEMQLFRLSSHQQVCQYGEVLCPNKSCGESVLKCSLNDHILKCPFRNVKCSDCHLECAFVELSDHKCVAAMRNHFEERMSILREELQHFIQNTTQERVRMEIQMEEQRNQIDTLQNRISALIAHRKKLRSGISTHHLTVPSPTMRMHRASPDPPRCAPASPLPPLEQQARQQHTHRRERSSGAHESRNTNQSLPRLAPLHTHMSLVSRNGHSHSSAADHPVSRGN